ncbi:MAG: hypothetical protein IPP69_18170 [Flavobacteriales bacterium]|nr:hypothetical protein [Flavobacteriales bacterium]
MLAIKNRGYRIGACRESVVYHYGGGTLDRLSPFKTYLNFRNNLYMIVKNYRTGNLTIKLVRRMLLDGVAAMRFITEGRFNYFTSVLKAHYSFYRNLSLLKKKRNMEEAYSQNPNLAGLYQGSIIKHFFLHKKHHIRDLDSRYSSKDQSAN